MLFTYRSSRPPSLPRHWIQSVPTRNRAAGSPINRCFERLILCGYAVADLSQRLTRRTGRGGGAGVARPDPGSEPGSETSAILGRIYKDRWEAAAKAGDNLTAQGLLNKAIKAYLHGFEADWRDAYSGVNAVTLIELKNPPDPRRLDLIPVVR